MGTKRVSLVGAEAISVDYDGDVLPAKAKKVRDRVFAQQTVVTVRDRLGKTTQVSVQWAIPLKAKQQLEEVVTGFAGKVPVSLAAAGARLLVAIAAEPPSDQTRDATAELRRLAAPLQAELAADPDDGAALEAARHSPRGQAALRALTTAVHHRAELNPTFYQQLVALVGHVEQTGPSRWLAVAAGVGLGLAAAAAGAIGWFLTVLLTDAQYGIVGAALGLLVGKAVVLGSGAAFSRPLQLVSVAVTLLGLVAAEYLIDRHFLAASVVEEGGGSVPVLLAPGDAIALVRDGLSGGWWILLFWALALWAAWRIPATRTGSGQGLRLPAAASRVWQLAGLAAGTIVLVGLGASVTMMGAADDGSPAGLGVAVNRLHVGQCFQQATQDEIHRVEVVPCSQPHDAEVSAIVPLRSQELPAEAELERLGAEACGDGFRSYVGVAAHESKLDYGWLVPNTEAWASGDRRIVCALEYPDDRRMVGSMRDTAVRSTPELRTFKLGRTVNVGAFRIRVTQLTCGYVELAELPPAEQGQYCVAELVARNLRSYPEWLYFEEQQLLVATGGTFKGYGLGKLLWDTDLQPGQSVATRLVFDLPRGLRPVRLRLHGYADQDWAREDIATIKLPQR
jgi:Septum formation